MATKSMRDAIASIPVDSGKEKESDETKEDVEETKDGDVDG